MHEMIWRRTAIWSLAWLVPAIWSQVPLANAADPATTAAEVDRLLAQELSAASGSPQADDETFLRRVFWDLVGQPPTVEDVVAFSLDTNSQKRAAIAETLLADPEYANNWARYWRDVLLYRRTEPRALLVSNSLTEFLNEQFRRNTPWDEIAAQFITATGDVRENGATGLIMAQAGRPEDVAAEVSRIFLGIQIQCAQCHDHRTDRWQREQFHQLAAFFPRIAVRPIRDAQPRSFEVSVNDRRFSRRRRNANNRFVGTPEHYMEDLDDPSSRGTLMEPVFFVSGEQLPLGTLDADRRGTLAEWMTARDNPWFARALVNRLWAELTGEGFYEPIDDMGPDREPTAPQTMAYLSDAFQDSGYDLQWMFATITRTEAYQRESRSRREYGEAPFAANCPQRLRGDQLYEALASALDLSGRQVASRNRNGRAGRGPRGAINSVFGFDPSEPRSEIASSIPQALVLMNAPFLDQAINARRPDGLGAILRRHADNADALTEVYLKTLSRAPKESEMRACLDYVRRVNDREEAFEDIQWALINSTEFLYRK